MDAFRIALTEKPRLFIKENIVKTVNSLFYYHPPTAPPFFHFNTSKNVDEALKNHYIISNKISINKDKSTCKKQVYN